MSGLSSTSKMSTAASLVRGRLGVNVKRKEQNASLRLTFYASRFTLSATIVPQLWVDPPNQCRIGHTTNGQQIGRQAHRDAALFAQCVDLIEGIDHNLLELGVDIDFIPEE